jgi:hypothetical protein
LGQEGFQNSKNKTNLSTSDCVEQLEQWKKEYQNLNELFEVDVEKEKYVQAAYFRGLRCLNKKDI